MHFSLLLSFSKMINIIVVLCLFVWGWGYKLANAAPIPDAANACAGRQALARRNTCGEGADWNACRVGCRSQIINVRFFPEMFYIE